MQRFLYLLAAVFLSACQQLPVAQKVPVPITDPASIDKEVAAMARPVNMQELIARLKTRWSGEHDRARATYAWVAHNIEYDTDAFFRGTAVATDAAGTFASGKSVCEGYSDLFTEIARGLGLEVQSIKGWAKGYGYRQGAAFDGTNHAWNAVKVDGRWLLVDSTWGAGPIVGRKFKRDYTAAWYDMDPRLFALHHLGEKTTPMAEFIKAPYLEHWHLEQWFDAGFSVGEQMTLAALSPLPKHFELYSAAFRKNGGTTQQLVSWLKQGEVPAVWHYPQYPAQILELPADGVLKAGKTYRFSVKMDAVPQVAVVVGDDFVYLQREGSTYQGNVVAKPGDVLVSAKIKHEGKETFWPLLKWTAR